MPNIRRLRHPKKKKGNNTCLPCLPVKGKHANISPICSLFAPLVHWGRLRSSRRISPYFLNKARRGEKGSGEKWMQHLAVKVAAALVQQAIYRKKRKVRLLHIHKVGGKEHIMSQFYNLGKENSIASSPLPSFSPKSSRWILAFNLPFLLLSRKPPPL